MSNGIDLTALHEAIKASLIDEFPSVSVDYYDRPGEKLTTPAIRFELAEINPANPDDTGTEQLEVELRFSAECVYAYKSGGKIGVRLLAASLAKFVQGNRFSSLISAGSFVSANPETFSDEYETWRVDWTHTALLGDSIWDGGIIPVEVNASAYPRIGTPFLTDYTRLV